MLCPSCQTENEAGAPACRGCGSRLSGITTGSVLAGRYEIMESLGKGGMGVVYRARDRVLDEVVAIKVLRSDVAQTPEMGRRFLAEIKLARKVTHKNVCRIHEYGQYDGLNYISMAYVDGVDLKHVLAAQGALPHARAFDVALQVAHGLHAIHEEGIVHRDLKAPNIMLDARGGVRLMDFGIAKDSADEGSQNMTATGMIVGTPEYMSPEQARGLKLDGRSDIYALGVVVYELFTGDVPFRGDTPIATIIQHLQTPPPLDRPEIPDAMVQVLHTALAKDPSERYATALEMAAALARARDATLPEHSATPSPMPTTDLPRVAPGPLETPAPTPIPALLPTPVPQRAAPLPKPVSIRRPIAIDSRPRHATLSEAIPASPAAAPQNRLWLGLLVGVGVAGMVVTGVVIAILIGRGDPSPALPPASTVAPTTTLPAASLPPTTAAPATTVPATTMAPPPTTAAMVAPPTTLPPPMTTTAPARPSPTPAPAHADGGFLQLVVVPWAEVTVDGQPVTTAPLRKIPLGEGSHLIRLEHPDYQPLQRKVTIRPGQVLSLTVDLPEEAIRRKN